LKSKINNVKKIEVESAFRLADEDDSGELDFNEFHKLFTETFVID